MNLIQLSYLLLTLENIKKYPHQYQEVIKIAEKKSDEDDFQSVLRNVKSFALLSNSLNDFVCHLDNLKRKLECQIQYG